MNTFRYLILMVCVTHTAAWSADRNLRIYLPTEKTMETDMPQLGQIALLLGDAELVQAAAIVNVGQFAATGQQLTIDRQTVLSCLASAGIDARHVQFNGAESVCVKRLEQTVAASRFFETARLFLESLPGESKASFKLLRPAQDLVIAEPSANIELAARLSGPQSSGTQRVTVAVMDGSVEIARQELLFTAQYERKRVVALQRLGAGAELTTENTRVETYLSNLPEEGEMFSPYGMVASKAIEAGRAIEPALVQPKTVPLMVKRQQQVVLRIDTDVLLVSAYGEAMEDGRIGDLIRVRRGSRQTNDERFVVGRVMQDGTVQPVLNY